MDEEIRVLFAGAQGRMGRIIVPVLSETPGIRLVAALDREDDLEHRLGEGGIDVAVDFTHPQAVMENAQLYIRYTVRPVIGTTGLSEIQVIELQQLCREKSLGGIIAPNFCTGAVLMMKYAGDAAQYFGDVEIIELHHEGKVDAPSGTSIKTDEMIESSVRPASHVNKPSVTETIPGCRGGIVGNVRIHSVRLPGLLAHQEVVFGASGQVFTIRHDVTDRIAFLPGILHAIRGVMTRDDLAFGLDAVL